MKKGLLFLAAFLLLLVSGLFGYVLFSTGPVLLFPQTPLPDIQASSDPQAIERGRYLFHGPAHCSQCHSGNDRDRPQDINNVPIGGGLELPVIPLGTFYARNLSSDEETGVGGIGDALLARTLQTGVMADDSLSFFMSQSAAFLSDEDIVAVISYMRTLAPVRREVQRGSFSLIGRFLFSFGLLPLEPRQSPTPVHVADTTTPSLDRGRYLAENVMLCTFCHTEFDKVALQMTGPSGGGSLPDPSHGDDSDMEFVAPNLTAHPTGITGRLDENQFVARMQAGRVFTSSIMPWENFAATTENDLRSVYRYLRSLPEVDNEVGATYRRGHL